jgi:hypothetical protein
MTLLMMTSHRYQSEVSTPETRGFMVSMHGAFFAAPHSTAEMHFETRANKFLI